MKTFINKTTGTLQVDKRSKNNIIREHGRKFIALLIALAMLLLGLVIKHFLNMQTADYEVFARYSIIALGVFSAGNTVNFGAAILKDIKNGGKKIE